MSEDFNEKRSRGASSSPDPDCADEDARVISDFAERNGISFDQALQVTKIFRRLTPIARIDRRTPALERALSV